MKISVTIPQLFYDIIARVLPGFLFYCILQFLLMGYNFSVLTIIHISGINFIATIWSGIGLIIIFHITGVVLTSFIFESYQKKVKNEFENTVNEKYNDLSVNDLYQCIRLKNEAAGFRLVKLRAEARFLDISRSMLCYIGGTFIVYNTIIWLTKIDWPNQSIQFFIFKCIALIIMIFGFRHQEEKSWKRYYGNVVRLYPIICVDDMKSK